VADRVPGHDLVDARRRLDPDGIRREIAATEANADQPWAQGSTIERTMASLQAQLATVERLEGVIGDADSRLRLLNARLDEAAARTIELSVQASTASELGGLGADVDEMVDEMEALRQAIEETEGGPSTRATGAG
jgi:phage shock protein A